MKIAEYFNLRLTRTEFFAVTELVNEALEKRRADEARIRVTTLNGIIRKAEQAIDAHHATRPVVRR